MAEYIGMDKEEIDTPALLIDLDLLEKNIKTVSDYYDRKMGAALRPHQKGHRLPMIARKQIDAGAKGVAMTSFGLAELYVNHGIRNILITNEICGKNKILRLCGLSKRSDVIVSVDNADNARQLSELALSNDTKINIAIEIYMGKGSCGVGFEETQGLVKQISRLRGINFKGLWWHNGSLGSIPRWNDRRLEEFALLSRIERLKSEIEKTGIGVEMLSGGHTCTWNITPEYEGLSNVEVQAGNYVFSDWVDQLLEGQEVFDCALTVLTRCISRPAPNEAVFDSGMNTCSDEAGGSSKGGYSSVVGPKFKNLSGIDAVRQREEIMVASFDHPSQPIGVGDVFELIPPHADTTAKMHDKYYCMRNNNVEAIWPNYGRGLF
jgi:D-serine deaminase-like pyridoxal phosphate-dependent protein